MAQALLAPLVLFFLSWVAAVAEPDACIDDDAKWASFGSTCAKMKWQCDVPGYGVLVQKWCPLTCGLCSPAPSDDDATDDTTAFISTTYESSSLDRTMVRKASWNTTGNLSLHTNTSASNSTLVLAMVPDGRNATNTSSAMDLNTTRVEDNSTVLLEPETLQIMQEPTKWEISLPKDAVLDLLSKATFVLPGAISTAEKDSFEFEISTNKSVATNASNENSTSAKVFEAEELMKADALVEDDSKRCPAGYEEVMGQVYGGDQYGRGYDLFATSIGECAQWCTQTPGCGSIEYSMHSGRCFRHSQTRPTDFNNRPRYILCRRAPCPSLLTEAACVGPAITSGWLSAEVNLRPGSYCIWSAGKCQAPMTCTYEDCFLPDGGLPGMDLPPSKTLWISRSGLMSTMAQKVVF